ncbi:DNase I-like protein [Rhizodiscina lignyota]|uniref:DNase I-like protein n=1 Tax=Rhizodiscina lignyota TaxID=1504668 RepID=A0A9P4IGU9_9PEZI|nr:DNase I-like protein [Rhizodiscina lignyota]
MASSAHPSSSSSDPTIHVLTLNCWGLKYISTHRHARLVEIGNRIASASPQPSLVCLQECWTQQDYQAIRAATSHILPHGKFYFSGIFGGGLAILSAWPIVESSMYRYPLNGLPAAFYRGDWFVGKGVACARIEMPADIFGQGKSRILEVFNTHLHAPYKPEPLDTYVCHRTAQAWEIAKLMRHAVERGHFVLGCGDFNMRPASLAHQLIETHSGVKDVWRVLHPDSSLGSANDQVERERGRKVPNAGFNVTENGATCDSVLNTWRWNKGQQKRLDKGEDITVALDTEDPGAKRLDYIFFGGGGERDDERAWSVEAANVGMMERHPELKCSLSDHFSVEATFRLSTRPADTPMASSTPYGAVLPPATYTTIADMIAKYTSREAKQRRIRVSHFFAQFAISIGCLVGVWWTPNYASFILMLVSTLGLSAGVIDGLMGFLFVNSEIRALKEFNWEIDAAKQRAVLVEAGKGAQEETLEVGKTGAGGHTQGAVGEPEAMREDNGKMEMVV